MKKSRPTHESPRVSGEAARARTGKVWSECFAILDAAGARKMNHEEILTYLRQHHGIPGWWDQMVTVAYEQARGMREKHQKPAGYEIGVSRTLGVSIAIVYKAWHNGKTRNRWLPETLIVIRKATMGKSLRMTWTDH